jgi:hypothetical protein
VLLLAAGAESSGPVGPVALSEAGSKLLQLSPAILRHLRPGPGGGGPPGGGTLEVTKPSGDLNEVVSSPNTPGPAETKELMGYHDG